MYIHVYIYIYIYIFYIYIYIYLYMVLNPLTTLNSFFYHRSKHIHTYKEIKENVFTTRYH